jgi:hypothetical protein
MCRACDSRHAWALDGVRRPSLKPSRPPAGATQAQLERLYPHMIEAQRKRIAIHDDGYGIADQAVLEWKSQLCADAGIDDTPLLSQTEAQDIVERVWRTHGSRFQSQLWFTAVPRVRVRPMNDLHVARSWALRHAIYFDQRWPVRVGSRTKSANCCCRVKCAGAVARCLVQLVTEEFGVDCEHALALAAQHGIELRNFISDSMVQDLFPLEWELFVAAIQRNTDVSHSSEKHNR